MGNESFRGEGARKEEHAFFRTGEFGQPLARDLLRVFDDLGAGIVFTDQDRLVTYANTAALRLLKPDGGPLQGQALRDLAPGGLGRLLEEKAVLVLRGQSAVGFQAFCPEPVVCRLQCRCLPLGAGVAFVFEDMGAAPRGHGEGGLPGCEGSLRQRLQELDAIYAAAPVGFCVVDEDCRFVRMNDRLADINGAPASEHIGKTVRDMAPSIADKAEAALRRVLETGEPMPNAGFTGSPIAGPDRKKSILAQLFPLKDASGRTVGVSVAVEEVTELEQAYQALIASEERYRVLYDSMSQGVVEYDAQGRLVSSNRAAREIAGMDFERLRGISIRDASALIPEILREDGTPFDADSTPASVSLATGREIKSIVARAALPGRQSPVWFSLDAIPWFEPGQGKPGGVFAIFSDITELKNAQEALLTANEDLERKVRDKTARFMKTVSVLKKQKETLQAVFDSIPVMLVFYDQSRNLKLVNREFERVTGWSLKDTKSRNFLSDIFPDPDYRRESWRFMTRAEGVWREFDIVIRSGETLASAWMSISLSDRSRICIGTDLRLHKKMGQDLAKFASAVEQAGDGIALIDPDGLIEYMNPALEAITGYKLQEVAGRPLSSLAGYLADDRHREMIDLISSQGKAWRGCQKRRRKNGEIYEASLSVTPVRDENGRIVNYVSVSRDVTSEAKLQQRLFHAQKMEALGTLAGGISHDLKNIFTPIQLDTEILMQDMGVGNPFYPILDEIHKATQLGLDLVKQVFIFSRNVRREKAPVDLYPVVRQVLSFLRASMPTTIDIDHQLNSRGALVVADPTQIQQVLMNLGNNAKHAMRQKGGLLTVRLDSVGLDDKAVAELGCGLAPGPYVEILVKDTGEGMDESTLQRIFDPFFTTKGKGDGSGLGLAVVHGIVKDHNGAITVWSRPGEGSVFRVLLPRVEDKGPKKKRPCT